MIKSTVSAVALLSLAGCITLPQDIITYCEARPIICALIGAVVVGGVIAIASRNNNGGSSSSSSSSDSDSRLKTDVRLVETLENGIKLYAYKYIGDTQTFVGVMAQEIAKMPKFSAAISLGKHGFYKVDYGKLGLRVIGLDKMQAAGAQAVQFRTSSVASLPPI